MPDADTPPPVVRADELRALLGRITPLPWGTTRYAGGFDFASGPLRAYAGTDPEYGEPRPVPQTDADVTYAVAAANALPALLDRLTALEVLLARVQWAYDGECPVCVNSERKGHAPDCALAALLGAEGEGGDG